MKDKLIEIISDNPDILQMHGFYVEEKNNVVSFDLIIDFKADNRIEIRDDVISQMKKIYPKYEFVAVLDNDFSD